MEFLDMNLTKDSSFLLHAIHNLFYVWILQKIILYCGFKTPCKSIRETEKLKSIHEKHSVEPKNEGIENQTKIRVWEDSSLCPETWTKAAVQEFHLKTSW